MIDLFSGTVHLGQRQPADVPDQISGYWLQHARIGHHQRRPHTGKCQRRLPLTCSFLCFDLGLMDWILIFYFGGPFLNTKLTMITMDF